MSRKRSGYVSGIMQNFISSPYATRLPPGYLQIAQPPLIVGFLVFAEPPAREIKDSDYDDPYPINA